jgi:hypothetical protein
MLIARVFTRIESMAHSQLIASVEALRSIDSLKLHPTKGG